MLLGVVLMLLNVIYISRTAPSLCQHHMPSQTTAGNLTDPAADQESTLWHQEQQQKPLLWGLLCKDAAVERFVQPLPAPAAPATAARLAVVGPVGLCQSAEISADTVAVVQLSSLRMLAAPADATSDSLGGWDAMSSLAVVKRAVVLVIQHYQASVVPVVVRVSRASWSSW
jgi:hypothetical protein